MKHKEAYCLMLYICSDCKAMEVLWNSRNGVTPFGINCRYCNNINIMHKHWSLDHADPEFKPHVGMRYFRDMTKNELHQCIKVRVKKYNIGIDPERMFKEEWKEGMPFVDTWSKHGL